MRLIDADRYIRDLCSGCKIRTPLCEPYKTGCSEWHRIQDATTVDARIVTYCKFCRYSSWHHKQGKDILICESEKGMYREVQPDDYCSYGVEDLFPEEEEEE